MQKTRLFVFPAKKKVAKSVYALGSAQNAKQAHELCCDCGLDPELLVTHKASVRQTHKRINCLVLEFPKTYLKPLSQKLRKQGHKTAPIKPVHLLLHESVPLMEVPEAWNSGLTGKGILIGIVDSGVDTTHPDFSNRIKSYRDFTASSRSSTLIPSSPHTPTPSPDRVGHGTHVAGIIVGGGSYYRGVAPEAELLVAKVFDLKNTTDDVVLAGLSWAAYSGAQVINLSLGGPGDPDDVLSQECDALMRDGILVCVAAGNSGPDDETINSPGTSRLAITVGAVDKEKRLTLYSSRGPVPDPKTGKKLVKPDLLACGGGYANIRGCDYKAGIVSTKSSSTHPSECSVSSPIPYTLNPIPLYEKMSGTSMATPHVSGICALLLQVVSGFRLQVTGSQNMAFQIKKILLKSCQNLKLPKNSQGSGFLSAKQALTLLTEGIKRASVREKSTVLSRSG